MVLVLEQVFQFLKNLAIELGRLPLGALLAGQADDASQVVAVESRLRRGEFRERLGFLEQALAPGFEAVEQRGRLAWPLSPGVELGPYRFGVHVAHQPADELHLAPTPLMGGDAPRRGDGVGEALRQVKLGEPFGGDRHQSFAQILQGMHGHLAAGLGRWLGLGRAALVVVGMDQVRISKSASCYDNPLSKIRGAMAANGEEFPLATEQLQSLAAEVLARARAAGATAAETEISQAVGQNVGVRLGEVETIEYNRDKGAGITVYLGQARGHVSTADLSSDALGAAVEKALAIARYTAPDPCAGLADTALLAREWVDLELYFPWALSAEDAIELARECEAAAFAVDPRVKNSEGANVSVHQAEFVYANSAGFCGGYRSSRHGISCAVIAETRAGMQRDHWYSSARAAADLEAAPAVGRKAGERAVRRLGAKKLATRQVPVLYEAPAATSLLGHFVAAASGGNLYRKASFLLDREGSAVFSPLINLSERPHLPRGPASAPFDDEGVATRAREVVAQGVLQGYFLGSYSARKLGRQTTGNAGGAHNLLLEGGSENFLALVKRLDRGLVVTELLGQGVNLVTGDYSRGAVGFWVEHGEIVHAVEEVTIAGNLGEMYRGIVAVGSDVDVRGSRQCGSILLENMTLAGS